MFVLQNDECITGKSSCNAELEVLSFMFLYKVILAVFYFIVSKQSYGFEARELMSKEAMDSCLYRVKSQRLLSRQVSREECWEVSYTVNHLTWNDVKSKTENWDVLILVLILVLFPNVVGVSFVCQDHQFIKQWVEYISTGYIWS